MLERDASFDECAKRPYGLGTRCTNVGWHFDVTSTCCDALLRVYICWNIKTVLDDYLLCWWRSNAPADMSLRFQQMHAHYFEFCHLYVMCFLRSRKGKFLNVKLRLFSHLSVCTYILSAEKNHLIEMVLWVSTTYVFVKIREYDFQKQAIIWKKTDPSEIERTYNISKQQTRYYRVCSWELMESATILMAHSTGLSSILFSARTQYFWRTRMWKNINPLYNDSVCPPNNLTLNLISVIMNSNLS